MSKPAQPIELVTIINSFNRLALLRRALASLTDALRKATFPSAIIVFEAGSNDGSREFLDDWIRENPADNLIVLRAADAASSFSDGVNTACAAALARFPQCRWLFLYETDNWIGKLEPVTRAITLLETRSELAAAGFTVRRHHGVFCGYGMRLPTYSSLALGLNLSALWRLEEPNESPWQESAAGRWRTCDVVFTSPLLIRREAWEETGGFDASAFPFSDSDVDWAWRCAERGWQMAVLETDAVVHDNLQQASAWSANRVLEFHRSRLRLLKRHRGNRDVLLKPILFSRHLLETLLLAARAPFQKQAQSKLSRRGRMLRTVWSDYL